MFAPEFVNLETFTFLQNTQIPEGPAPPNLLDKQFTLVPAVNQDTTPFLSDFGDVKIQPQPSFAPGDLVSTIFVGGHPKHSTMREGTFLLVEKENTGNARWELVRTGEL